MIYNVYRTLFQHAMIEADSEEEALERAKTSGDFDTVGQEFEVELAE